MCFCVLEIARVKERVIWRRKGADVRISLSQAVKWRLTSLWRGSGGNRLLPGNSKHTRHTHTLVSGLIPESWIQVSSFRFYGCHFNGNILLWQLLKSRASNTMSIIKYNDSVWPWKHKTKCPCLKLILYPAGKIGTQQKKTFSFSDKS